MRSLFSVWFWNGSVFAPLNCPSVTATQAAGMLMISSVPLLFLPEGDEPPEQSP
jgi:hypothetical protein